jgi:hypothetical protein
MIKYKKSFILDFDGGGYVYWWPDNWVICGGEVAKKRSWVEEREKMKRGGKKVLFEERNRRIAFLGHELLIYGSVFIFLLKF